MQYPVVFQYQLLHYSSVLNTKRSQVGQMHPVSIATQNTQSQKNWTCTNFAALWQIWTCDDVTVISTEINKILSVLQLIAWHVLCISSASPECGAMMSKSETCLPWILALISQRWRMGCSQRALHIGGSIKSQKFCFSLLCREYMFKIYYVRPFAEIFTFILWSFTGMPSTMQCLFWGEMINTIP